MTFAQGGPSSALLPHAAVSAASIKNHFMWPSLLRLGTDEAVDVHVVAALGAAHLIVVDDRAALATRADVGDPRLLRLGAAGQRMRAVIAGERLHPVVLGLHAAQLDRLFLRRHDRRILLDAAFHFG